MLSGIFHCEKTLVHSFYWCVTWASHNSSFFQSVIRTHSFYWYIAWASHICSFSFQSSERAWLKYNIQNNTRFTYYSCFIILLHLITLWKYIIVAYLSIVKHVTTNKPFLISSIACVTNVFFKSHEKISKCARKSFRNEGKADRDVVLWGILLQTSDVDSITKEYRIHRPLEIH